MGTGFASRAFSIGFLLSALSVVGAAHADTLIEVLAKTYRSNPQIQAEQANLRATEEGVAQATALMLPQIEAGGDYSKIKTESKTAPGPGAEGRTEPWSADIAATQTIFAGGRLIAQRRAASAGARAGRARLKAIEQTVLLDAVTAYMNVVRDETILALSRANVILLEHQFKLAKARLEVGEITKTDVAQAEARLAAGQADLSAAEGGLKASRLFFERTVGEAPSSLEDRPPLPALPASEEEALSFARARNPNLELNRELEAAARFGIDVAVGQMLPTVTVRASYGWSGQERGPETIGDETRVTASFTMPIFQGGGEWASIRKAKDLGAKARLDLEVARRRTDEEVANAWQRLRTTEASSQANERQVTAAEIAFAGTQKEFEVGARTTLDVLNQQQELLNARVALVRSTSDRVFAAYALLAAMGDLTAEALHLSGAGSRHD